ncbi:hypothetical protein [Cellulomonas sp. URHD0024]|uniref:hypothetical protein n=1 Tax=Cellulomonas sp. URHD0024 TaxID=1302620 RepID=UPI0004184DAD|nr:hypothetical protein [Cellulomonas sp. URHD0024]
MNLPDDDEDVRRIPDEPLLAGEVVPGEPELTSFVTALRAQAAVEPPAPDDRLRALFAASPPAAVPPNRRRTGVRRAVAVVGASVGLKAAFVTAAAAVGIVGAATVHGVPAAVQQPAKAIVGVVVDGWHAVTQVEPPAPASHTGDCTGCGGPDRPYDGVDRVVTALAPERDGAERAGARDGVVRTWGDRFGDGAGWDRAGWDGAGWDGAGWDGAGWDGAGWDGAGWDGAGWDGAGWDGAGWDGVGWDGVTRDFSGGGDGYASPDRTGSVDAGSSPDVVAGSGDVPTADRSVDRWSPSDGRSGHGVAGGGGGSSTASPHPGPRPGSDGGADPGTNGGRRVPPTDGGREAPAYGGRGSQAPPTDGRRSTVDAGPRSTGWDAPRGSGRGGTDGDWSPRP